MMLKPLAWDGSTIYIQGSTIMLLPTLIQLDGTGRLPLVLAARHENDTCFQLLQRYGARIDEHVTNVDEAFTLIKSPETALSLLQQGLLSTKIILDEQRITSLYTAFAKWCSAAGSLDCG
eukprot:scaffold8601_cov191-Amphora_coffeaeformis.AAC.10